MSPHIKFYVNKIPRNFRKRQKKSANFNEIYIIYYNIIVYKITVGTLDTYIYTIYVYFIYDWTFWYLPYHTPYLTCITVNGTLHQTGADTGFFQGGQWHKLAKNLTPLWGKNAKKIEFQGGGRRPSAWIRSCLQG